MARLASALIGSFLSLAACAPEAPPDPARDPLELGHPELSPPALGEAPQAVDAVEDLDVLLPWGSAGFAIGWRAPAEEFRGDGPSGIAIAPTGAVVVVDRLNRRLVEVHRQGLIPRDAIAEDVELLAFGSDGAWVAASPFRARAWVHERNGDAVGEVALSRLLGDATRVALIGSRQVEITTALQERFVIGSPSAPRDPADVLRSKREGALAGSEREPALVAVRGEDGALRLDAVAAGARRSSTTRWATLGDGDAVQLIGRTQGHVVAVTEKVDQPAEALVVTRTMVVVDAKTGVTRATHELPRGLWVPRESIAVAVGAPTVAFMTPTPEGLRVTRLDLDALVAGGARCSLVQHLTVLN